jgi:hypothetical protein
MDLWGLHKNLSAQFDSDELETLALGVGMKRGDFSSERTEARATELIDFSQRRGKLATLAKYCAEKRNDIDWAVFVQEEPAQSTQQSTQQPPQFDFQPPKTQPQHSPPAINPQLLPLVGVWQIMNPIGQTIGWLRINADFTFQFSGPMGQAGGMWWWNTMLNVFQSQGAYVNGVTMSPAFSIQQWLPNGFLALGGDGVLYMHVRAG